MEPTIRRPQFTKDDMMDYKGKNFVFYHALLREAQAQGLRSLDAIWTYNDAGLSLAWAVAVFEDGRRYTEAADATPENVGSFVKPHFRRMALTRAKARALRDALGVMECSTEELGKEEDEKKEPATVPMMSSGPVAQPKSTPSPQPASALGPQASFLASTLRRSERDDGRVFWSVMGEGIPQRYARYGISLSPQTAQASEVDLDETTDIQGWRVEWSTREYQGKVYANVEKLIDPDAAPRDDDGDSDVPF